MTTNLPSDRISDEAWDAHTAARSLAFAMAAHWLRTRHERAFLDAMETGYFGGLDRATRARIDEAPERVRDWIRFNSCEWMVAEGRLRVGRGKRERTVAAAQVALGPEGAPLTPEQRAFVAELARRPLGIYRTERVASPDILTARDLLAPDAPLLRVDDRDALAGGIEVGDVFGARLLPAGESLWEFSPAFYPLGAWMRDLLLEDLPRLADRAGQAVITAWLIETVAPRAHPQS